MSCARPEQLARWIDGDATQNEVISLANHVASCNSCQLTKRRLERTVDLVREAHPVRELSRATVERYGRRFREQASQRTSAGKQRLWGAGLAGAAAAVLVTVVVSPVLWKPQVARETSGSASEGEWTARGSVPLPQDMNRRLGVEVFRHDVQGRTPAAPARLQEGARITAKDGFSFIVYNRSGKAWHYMIFGLDARNEVHWFYPAYTVAGSNPEAPALPPSPEVISLPDGVTAEAPAQGKLQMVALFSPEPFRVDDVESQVTAGNLGRLAQMPGSVVQVLNLDVLR